MKREKHPFSFSLHLTSLISMHMVSGIKASSTKRALELLFKVFTSIYFIVIIPTGPSKSDGVCAVNAAKVEI